MIPRALEIAKKRGFSKECLRIAALENDLSAAFASKFNVTDIIQHANYLCRTTSPSSVTSFYQKRAQFLDDFNRKSMISELLREPKEATKIALENAEFLAEYLKPRDFYQFRALVLLLQAQVDLYHSSNTLEATEGFIQRKSDFFFHSKFEGFHFRSILSSLKNLF